MNKKRLQQLQKWLKSQPPEVRALADEFPLQSRVFTETKVYYIIGYTEDDHVIVSPYDPVTDYDASVDLDNRFYIRAKHLRENKPVQIQ